MRECIDAIRRHSGGQSQSALLERLYFSVERSGKLAYALTVPLIVCKAARGDILARDHVLVSALALLEASIYILDHVLDGEVDEDLADLKPGGLVLGAGSMISHLPNQILVRMGDGVPVLPLIRMLNDGQAMIAAGQLDDIGSTLDMIVPSSRILKSVTNKTGERRGLYAAMAACAAGAPPERVADYARFGCCLGVARQIRSDLFDLLGEKPSPDLVAGVQTLPIALFFEQADEEGRTEMRGSLATPDPSERQHAVAALLARSETICTVVDIIQQQCQQAMSLVDLLSSEEAGRAPLAAVVQDTALFDV